MRTPKVTTTTPGKINNNKDTFNNEDTKSNYHNPWNNFSVWFYNGMLCTYRHKRLYLNLRCLCCQKIGENVKMKKTTLTRH